MELHSTILIDRTGHVHWARNGGEPFSDIAFLVKQLERMNAAASTKGHDHGRRVSARMVRTKPLDAKLHFLLPRYAMSAKTHTPYFAAAVILVQRQHGAAAQFPATTSNRVGRLAAVRRAGVLLGRPTPETVRWMEHTGS